jgi:hypothetical protein
MFIYDPSFKAAARSSALKKSTPNPDTGKALDLPAPGGPATMNIRGANLSTEIAVDSVPHVGGKIGVHAFPICIGNAEAFQLFRCCLNPLSGRLQMRVGLRSGQLCCMSRGHYFSIVFLPEDECDSTPSG